MELISGIWLLDVLNILKYQGVDIFDSIVNISPGTWCLLIFVTILVYGVLGGITAMLDK